MRMELEGLYPAFIMPDVQCPAATAPTMSFSFVQKIGEVADKVYSTY